MRIKKGLLVLAAVALPLATVALGEGTAFAKKVTGSGTTSCHFGGTISFNPPLTSAGSTSIKKEVTTVSASLTGCTGGTPPGPNTTASIKPIKTKTAKGSAGGTCASFESNATSVTIKIKVKWAGEKPSKFDISGLHVSFNAEGEAGFTGSFPVSGSYAGTGSVAAYLTSASTAQIATCSGSVSSLQLDSSTSSGSI
jgi:hypothetical protein